jgi:hypothetical protein
MSTYSPLTRSGSAVFDIVNRNFSDQGASPRPENRVSGYDLLAAGRTSA